MKSRTGEYNADILFAGLLKVWKNKKVG